MKARSFSFWTSVFPSGTCRMVTAIDFYIRSFQIFDDKKNRENYYTVIGNRWARVSGASRTGTPPGFRVSDHYLREFITFLVSKNTKFVNGCVRKLRDQSGWQSGIDAGVAKMVSSVFLNLLKLNEFNKL